VSRPAIAVTCDDLGYCETFNEAILEILKRGIVRSASLMPPAPAFEDAVHRLGAAGIDEVGVHLTLGSEYRDLPVRPLSPSGRVPTLIDERGCFFKAIEDVRTALDLRQVILELEAQIDRVQSAGFRITHLDGHMFFYEPEFGGPAVLAVAESLARRLGVPLRRRMAGVHMFWDDEPKLEGRIRAYVSLFRTWDAAAGELIIHPGKDEAAMRRFCRSHQRRLADYLFFGGPLFAELVAQRNIRILTAAEAQRRS
jgi:predicted glycoside hydrolase/deacetylase ChbG (UPF0249 family)